jgi:hypothetical protein
LHQQLSRGRIPAPKPDLFAAIDGLAVSEARRRRHELGTGVKAQRQNGHRGSQRSKAMATAMRMVTSESAKMRLRMSEIRTLQ